MKKLTCLMGTMIVCFTMLLIMSISAIAETGTCGDNLTWSLYSNGLLYINGTGDMYDYSSATGSFPSPFRGLKVKELEFDYGVTSIGDNAFSGRSDLYSVTLPDTMTRIGAYAFESCYVLSSVSLPSSITSIGAGAFGGCSKLSNINIPYGVTAIADSLFASCYKLVNITIPSSVTSIGDNAFAYSGLTSITLPDSVTTIGAKAFRASSLESVTLPETITSIAADAFQECQFNPVFYAAMDGNLAHLLSKIDLPFRTPGTEYDVKYLYDGDEVTGLEYSRAGGNSASPDIPAGVTSIGDNAFSNDIYTTIILPDGVKSIGYCAFFNCRRISAIYLPATLTSIDDYAFGYCTGLTDVYYSGTAAQKEAIDIGTENDCLRNANWHCQKVIITNGTCGNNLTWTLDDAGTLTISGTGAMTNYGYSSNSPWYSYRENIYTVELTTGITSIGNDAFSGCGSLTGISIPDGVTSIGQYAFDGCGSLASITIPDSVISIGNDAFSSCSGLTSITIPDGVTSIESDSFYDCSGLTSIMIPDGVTSIGSCAFSYCSSLTGITIPDGVTSIGFGAFSYCSSLMGIMIPEGMTSIGSDAFCGCSSLTGITIPDGVTSIGYGTFWGCSRLTSITIPDSVTSIGEWAFSDCSSLTTITIPEGVTSIGKRTFSYCRSLTSITVPEGVTSIGEGAFENCSRLTTISIPEGVTSICKKAFSGCFGLTCVELSYNLESIDQEAFSGCAALVDVYYHGTADQRAVITVGIDNEALDNATWHYCHAVVMDDSISQGTIVADHLTAFENEIVTLVATPDEGYDLESLTVMQGETPITLTDNQFVMPNGEVTVYATFKPEIIASGACGAEGNNITWALDSQGLLVISGTGVMEDYTADTAPFKKTDMPISINTVVVEPGVTHIGAYTFHSSSIKEVQLPAGLTSFGEHAFSLCSGLTEMEIPEGVTEISERMFVNCTGLQRVTLPSSLTDIGTNAFLFCLVLTDVTLPENLEQIGEGAFNQCLELAEIVIPSSVNTIGKTAFRGCSSLTSVSLPYGITGIGAQTFDSCRALISVEIPETVTRIDYQAFSYCVSLTAIEIPSSVNVIGNGVFKGCTGLTGVEIPSSIARINENTFKGCTGLTSIVVPDGVSSIDKEAFSDCTELTCVELPSDLETIDQKAFSGCTGLADVYYHGTAEQRTAIAVGIDNEVLDNATWHYCHAIVVDDSISQGTIAADQLTAFENEIVTLVATPDEGCVLESLTVMQGEMAITLTDNQFAMPDGEVTVTAVFVPGGPYGNNLHWMLHSDGTLVIDGAGQMDGTLMDFVDGAYITRAPWAACVSDVHSIVIGNGVTSIGYGGVFVGCNNMTSVTIPESVDHIGNHAFYNCSSLTDVVFPEGMINIEDAAFYGCSSLTSVTLPSTLTGIGDSAFYSCGNLTDLDLPEGVTSIGNYAFEGCGSLTEITLPASLTVITYHAFCNCINLTGITIPGTVTRIGECAFYGCNNLTGITIPDSVASIGDNAFPKYCETLEVKCNTYAHTWVKENGYGNKAVDSSLSYGYISTNHQTIDSDASVAPTCTEAGLTEGTHCADCGDIIVKQEIVPALGHDWAEAIYTWTDDNSNVMASHSCVRDDCNVTEEETAGVIGEITKQPGCTINGETTYTSAEFVNEAFSVQTKTEANILALGHEWSEVSYTWSEDNKSVTATRICARDEEHLETETVAATGEITRQPTCTVKGETSYTSAAFENEAFTVQTKVVEDIDMLGHVPVTDAAVPSTCAYTGLTEGSHCGVCGVVLVEQQPVAKIAHTYVTDQAVSATCTETGLTVGFHCNVCGEVFINQEVVPALGHDWGEATYAWSEDNKSVTATRTCMRDETHMETETAATTFTLAKAPTETELGETTYTADFAYDIFSTQTKTVADLPALTDLDLLKLPAGLKVVEDEALMGLACGAVIIPDGCTTIGTKAFANCINLVYIKIPESVTSIAEDAFDGSPMVRIDRIE